MSELFSFFNRKDKYKTYTPKTYIRFGCVNPEYNKFLLFKYIYILLVINSHYALLQFLINSYFTINYNIIK